MRTLIVLAVLLIAGPALAQRTASRASPHEMSRSSVRLTADDLNRIVLMLLRGEDPASTSERLSAALANIRRRMGLS